MKQKKVFALQKSSTPTGLIWYTNMADMTSRENALLPLLIYLPGAGKTYTMMGTDQDPGVNIRSILELLRVCDERATVDYSMCVSMVEVYNETVRDLLSENGSSQQLTIQMRNKQLVITDVTEVDVKSAADIKSIMDKGRYKLSLLVPSMATHFFYNLGQNKKEQLTPIPPKAMMKAREEQNAPFWHH